MVDTHPSGPMRVIKDDGTPWTPKTQSQMGQPCGARISSFPQHPYLGEQVQEKNYESGSRNSGGSSLGEAPHWGPNINNLNRK